MGLDQFAFRVKRGFIKDPVDFVTEKYDEETTFTYSHSNYTF